MSLDFSWFADDMVLEILGHLPALDIVRYRRVCKRIYLASKERSVWVNAFLRSECPLPPLDLETAPVEKLEKTLVRMEIMHAKWTGSRPTRAQVRRNSFTRRIFCVMPPYLVQLNREENGSKIIWFHRDDPDQIVEEHQTRFSWRTGRHYDPESGALTIAEVQEESEGSDQKTIKVVRYEVTGEKSAISKTLENEIVWPNASRDDIAPAVSIKGDYVVIETDHPRTIYLAHLKTGKMALCPVHNSNHSMWNQLTERFVTPPLFIQVDHDQLAVFTLPTEEEWSSSDLTMLRKTHTGVFPRGFTNIHIFHRSATSFFVIGTTNEGQGFDREEPRTHLRLLIVDLDEHSSACHIREDDEYNVAGHMHHFSLAPCSPTSRSTLGLLGVRVPAPTHSPTGRRIARNTRAIQPFFLGIKVDFGREDSKKSSISLTELELLDSEAAEKGMSVECINYFDPYAGQIRLQERSPQGASVECVIVDYLST
ncbi:hypothetical protein NP233_g1148 [Leucocoprinus birnbaumii]|uniref:F-box domain-containing protein n=1 Tax=Leucocoprinus birnbaumii TaxID=56174 RepID=A0AAD5W4I7_9AGAR|nr:hypothetical protein NP233_g1148 [Leucocoprinus birnbaumii]